MPHEPDENEWFLLHITDMEEISSRVNLVIDQEIVESEVQKLMLTLTPVSSHYENKNYMVPLFLGNPVIAYSESSRRKTPHELGFQRLDELNLRNALGISLTEDLTKTNILGKKVMANCFYKEARRYTSDDTVTVKKFPIIRQQLAHPDGVLVPVTTNEGVIPGRAVWDSVWTAFDPKPGAKVRVILPGGQQITAIRVQDHWRDINE